MSDPVPGAPDDDTRSLTPGADGGDSYVEALSVDEWTVPEQLGPYRIVRELGRGGMAAVYLATHADDGREVALKVMAAADDAAGRELVARFDREGVAAQRLGDHPNIVTVYESGREGRYCWMAMAVIAGAPLDALCDSGDLSFEQAAFIIERIARAVEHAHAGGVLHRDIKPSNILVRPNGTPLLADFGLARGYGGPDVTRLTASGTVLGTPSYMPPEQARGETLDARADIYALGATLYELLTGRPPFTAGRLLALLQKVVSEAPPMPRELNPAVPPRLEWIVLKCLEKDPAGRYPTAAALASDLERFRTGEAVAAGRGNRRRRLIGLWRRRPLLAGASVAAGLTAAVTGGLLWWHAGTQRGTRDKIAQTHAAAASLDREQQIAEAYYAVASRTQEAMRRLEDFANGAPLTREELDTLLRTALGEVETVRAKYPESGVPAAWAGLLRFYSGDENGGEAAVADAVARHPDDPYPHLILGRVCATRYIRRISGGTLVFGVGRVDYTPLKEDERNRALRMRMAEAFADGLDESRWRGVAGGEAYRAFAGAAALFAARSNGEAAEALAGLFDDPELGRTALAMAATADMFGGAYAAAAARFEALAASGWVIGFLLGSNAHLAHGLELLGRGEDPTAHFERVQAMAEELLQRSRNVEGPLIDRAAAREGLAKWRLAAGEDARALLRLAIDDVGRAMAARPSPERLMHRAQLGIEMARAERQFGGEPGRWLQSALDDIAQAVQARADVAEWRATRAEALFQLGLERQRSGKDPKALFVEAAQDLEAVRATVQDPAATYHTLGNIYRALARVADADGEDPFTWLDRAIGAYGEVMRLLPADARPASGRGAAWAIRAEMEAARTADPEASFEKALADFAEAIRRNPKQGSAVQNRAACWSAKGRADEAFGRDPAPALRESIRGFGEALALTPGHPHYLEGRGQAWWRLAQALRRRGEPPVDAIRAALADFAEAVERDPRSVRLRLIRARVLREIAPWPEAAAADAVRRQWLQTAIEDHEQVERLRPGSTRNLLVIGALHETLGQWAGAAAAYDRALKLEPGHPEILQARDAARARAR